MNRTHPLDRWELELRGDYDEPYVAPYQHADVFRWLLYLASAAVVIGIGWGVM